MATIEKRSGKAGITYRARVRKAGQPERTATFKRRTDAKAWAAETESKLNNRRYVPTAQDRRRTLSDLIDRYLDEVLPKKRLNRDHRSVRSRLTWWREELGEVSLANLTPSLIADARNKLAKRKNRYGERLSPATINRYLAVLGHPFRVAIREWGWMQDSPLRHVERGSETDGRTRYLSDTERQAFLKACKDSRNDSLLPIVQLALTTGARKGEILGLRWENVSFERGTITFPETKNRDPRTVPLVGPGLEALRNLHRNQRGADFVFPGRGGRSPASIDTAFQFARERAGISDFRFHDLRHTAASYLAMSGATLAEIAEILGHKTLQMVKRYSHLSEQHTSEVVNRMAGRFLSDD